MTDDKVATPQDKLDIQLLLELSKRYSPPLDKKFAQGICALVEQGTVLTRSNVNALIETFLTTEELAAIEAQHARINLSVSGGMFAPDGELTNVGRELLMNCLKPQRKGATKARKPKRNKK